MHVAAMYLSKPLGGKGVLMAGVPGSAPAVVVIVGGGDCGVQRGACRGRNGRVGLPARKESGEDSLFGCVCQEM